MSLVPGGSGFLGSLTTSNNVPPADVAGICVSHRTWEGLVQDVVSNPGKYELSGVSSLSRRGIPIDGTLFDPTASEVTLAASDVVSSAYSIHISGGKTLHLHDVSSGQVVSTTTTEGGSPTSPTNTILSPGSVAFYSHTAVLQRNGQVSMIVRGDFSTVSTIYHVLMDSNGNPLTSNDFISAITSGPFQVEPRVATRSQGSVNVFVAKTEVCFETRNAGGSTVASDCVSISTNTSTPRKADVVELSNGGNILALAEDTAGSMRAILKDTNLANVNTNLFTIAGSDPAMKMLPNGRVAITYRDLSGQLVFEERETSGWTVTGTAVVSDSLTGRGEIAVNSVGDVAIVYTRADATGSFVRTFGAGYQLNEPVLVTSGDRINANWINDSTLAVNYVGTGGKNTVDYLHKDTPIVLNQAVPDLGTAYVSELTSWTVPAGFATDANSPDQTIEYNVALRNGNPLSSVGADFSGGVFNFTPASGFQDTTQGFKLIIESKDVHGNVVERRVEDFDIPVGNRAPVVANPVDDQTVAVGQSLNIPYDNIFSDNEGGLGAVTAQFRKNGNLIATPAWVIDDGTALTGAVPPGAQGNYTVTFGVSDGVNPVVNDAADLTIPNDKITFTTNVAHNATVARGGGFTYNLPNRNNVDGDQEFFFVENNPGFISVNAGGVVSGNVAVNEILDTTSFKVGVRDAFTTVGTADKITINLDIVDVAAPPQVVGVIPNADFPAGGSRVINVAQHFFPQDGSLTFTPTLKVFNQNNQEVSNSGVELFCNADCSEVTITGDPQDLGLRAVVEVKATRAGASVTQIFSSTVASSINFAPVPARVPDDSFTPSGVWKEINIPDDMFSSKLDRPIDVRLDRVGTATQYSKGLFDWGSRGKGRFKYDSDTGVLRIQLDSESASGVCYIFVGSNEYGEAVAKFCATTDEFSPIDYTLIAMSVMWSVYQGGKLTYMALMPGPYKDKISQTIAEWKEKARANVPGAKLCIAAPEGTDEDGMELGTLPTMRSKKKGSPEHDFGGLYASGGNGNGSSDGSA